MTSNILRNIVMRHGAKIQLSPIEKTILWHIIDHDHYNKGISFPSEPTLAKLVGVSDRYVREIIIHLETKKKLITVKRKFGFSNQYRWGELKKALLKFWKVERKTKKTKKATPEPQFRRGRNHSSGDPGTIVPPNTTVLQYNTAYTYSNAKTNTPSKKYQMRTALKNQLEFDFNKPKEVVKHLREITTHEGNGKAAADLTLRILEQLWTWGYRDELLNSWKWFFYAAATWPTVVEKSWAEIKDRKLRGENMKKPGAILTLRIKELTNGNPKDQNHA